MEKSELEILIVDDEGDILNAVQTHLEIEGYSVRVASSGTEALEILKQRGVHLVLTDINMPGMDGIELLEEIKELPGDTPVIMMTAYSTAMKVFNSRMHGAIDYVLKPFADLSELENVVERAFVQINRWAKILESTRLQKASAAK